MLRSRINSDLDSLDDLNRDYPWIPNSISIRPIPSDIEKKSLLSKQIQCEWIEYRDYILHFIFRKKFLTDNQGKKYICKENIIDPNSDIWYFVPSTFRYNIIPESNHWVLWNIEKDFYYEHDEILINNIILNKLNLIGIDIKKCQFAWYKNPKPTIPEFFHIQVFWIQ